MKKIINIFLDKVVMYIHYIANMYCKYDLFLRIEGIEKIIIDYSKKSGSTGTKYTTLRLAVKKIQKHKPNYILECGTGVSTIVLGECILQLKKADPLYAPKLISMESVEFWYLKAKEILPREYHDIINIIYGERKLYEFHMFRGYTHSNIPKLNYDFIFLDGPGYKDDRGLTCCMDFVHVREDISDCKEVKGVIDTRVSSVFICQQLYGFNSVRYLTFLRSSFFKIQKLPVLVSNTPPSKMFKYNFFGKVTPKMPSLSSINYLNV
jgi:hypothetical protein